MAVAIANAREYVPRPGPGYELLPYGLFTVANGPLDLPPHAIEGGLNFESPYCTMPSCYQIQCSPGSKSSAMVGGWTNVNADPFVVLAGSVCGFSNDSSSDARTRELVLSKLYAGEQRVVENVFSRGLCGQGPGLSTSSATQLAASANIVAAFGLLESNYGANFGLPGVIHVPLIAMAQVMNAHQVEKVGNKWMTASGNAVNFGNYAGYSATDGAPAAGHTNIYITGPVTLWRSPTPYVSPWDASVDKSANQIRRYAEREWAATYECLAYATDVDYTACC